MRIPGWAVKATVDGKAAQNGTLVATDCAAGQVTTIEVDFAPAVVVERGWGSNESVGDNSIIPAPLYKCASNCAPERTLVGVHRQCPLSGKQLPLLPFSFVC